SVAVVNHPPVLTPPDDQTSAEGDPISLAVSATDPDGNALSFAASGLPAGLSMNAATGIISGTIGFSAAETQHGSYTVTVSANDGFGGSDSQTFTWTVADTNRPPLAGNDYAAAAINTPVTIAILANDSDPDGDPLTVSLLSTGSYGTAVLNNDATVTYTPDFAYTGTDSFS